MTIRYSNGQAFEAVLLSQTEESMRIAIEGSEDVLELSRVGGAWISEECEPVQVEYAWTRLPGAVDVREEDCVCSPELAARLLHLLFSGENEPETRTPAARRAALLPIYHHVV
jgi:hypothetical protein